MTLTESDFQHQVIDLAHICHWRVAHFRAARMQSGRWATPVQADGAGFPDLVLVRGGRLIFAELKVRGGRLGCRQADWLMALSAVADEAQSVLVRIWHPEDMEEIRRELAA